MSATITDLPPEILSTLFSFVQGKYLAPIAQTCKLFNEAVQIDSIWRQRCLEEYNVENVDTEVLSWKEVYTKLLFHCGYTLGLWQAVITHYGGLLHVKFTGSKIEGTEYLTPPDPHIEHALRPRPLFNIELDRLGCRKSLCRRGYQDCRHPVTLTKSTNDEDWSFKYECGQREHHAHQANPDGPRAVFVEWLRNETGDPNLVIEDIHGHELILMKFMMLLEFECDIKFSRLKVPPPPSYSVPIQPGLFKGTYGLHGVEIIFLHYTDDKQVIGTKITGDPNIPANKLSIKADLNRTMILTAVQQTTMSVLQDIDTPDIPSNVSLDKLPKQQFILPSGCMDRHRAVPSSCIYRCHSQGQLAGHGYTSPSCTPGHWIVFDENTFGHIWIDLRSLSLYSRITEDLLN